MCSQFPWDQPAPLEGYLPFENAQLYYRAIGQGQPLILLHGGPSFSHTYLLPDMDRLADAFRLISYDQRGRGKSAGNVDQASVSIQSEMDDLERVRAYFQLERAALLGHSWGGLLALEYALRHPARVSHLILLNTAPASYEDCVLFEQECDGKAPEDAALVRELESSPAYEAGDLEARAAANRVYFRATLRSPELLWSFRRRNRPARSVHQEKSPISGVWDSPRRAEIIYNGVQTTTPCVPACCGQASSVRRRYFRKGAASTPAS